MICLSRKASTSAKASIASCRACSSFFALGAGLPSFQMLGTAAMGVVWRSLVSLFENIRGGAFYHFLILGKIRREMAINWYRA